LSRGPKINRKNINLICSPPDKEYYILTKTEVVELQSGFSLLLEGVVCWIVVVVPGGPDVTLLRLGRRLKIQFRGRRRLLLRRGGVEDAVVCRYAGHLQALVVVIDALALGAFVLKVHSSGLEKQGRDKLLLNLYAFRKKIKNGNFCTQILTYLYKSTVIRNAGAVFSLNALVFRSVVLAEITFLSDFRTTLFNHTGINPLYFNFKIVNAPDLQSVLLEQYPSRRTVFSKE
jgi:hypothetical protein